MKFIIRKLLINQRIRNIFCFIRAFYFCKIKKKMRNYVEISEDTWKNTLDSNKRAILDENINLPAYPKRKTFFDLGISHSGGKSNWLLKAIETKYFKKEYKKLKILSIGPRSEGEIFNLFANGFELKNIAGIDIFSYSPLIQLSDMHNIKLEDNKFDIVLMGWCLAYSNNKVKAINEAKRVLKKDGSLIIGYSVSSKSDQDIINERGYLVGSPYNKITSMKILDELIKFCGLKTFYSKTIDKKISQRLIYGAEK